VTQWRFQLSLIVSCPQAHLQTMVFVRPQTSVFPPGLVTSKGEVVDLLLTNRYSLTTLTDESNKPSNRERKLTKPLHAGGPGMELPPKSYRGRVGVTDQARMYVTTCSETFPLSPQSAYREYSKLPPPL
jgi:hypothetical protein